jgi:8-hydroxy-5-deazaflavin:NADPH oxidoreductase
MPGDNRLNNNAKGELTMRIGIIGAGHIGSALARRLTEHGHRIVIANSRGPETLGLVAERTGASPVEVGEAVRGVDLIVLTIPMKNVSRLASGLFASVPPATPVIDTCNYYPRQRDGRIAEIEDGLTESAYVARQIGHGVVKTFNSIYAQHLEDFGKESGSPGRIALPVAGDDQAAKAIVLTLVESLGFDALDAGPISESWRQQPGTPAYCTDLGVAALRKALAEASPTRTADWRA